MDIPSPMDIASISRYRERFWVKSTPGEEFPAWHNEPCHMEVDWQYDLQRPSRNENGVTGWAAAQTVSIGKFTIGEFCRIHICSHTPCNAHWKVDKYGAVGEPMHVTCVGPPAVAGHLVAPESVVSAVLADAGHPVALELVETIAPAVEPATVSPKLAGPTTDPIEPTLAEAHVPPELVRPPGSAVAGHDVTPALAELAEPLVAVPAAVAPPVAPDPNVQPLMLPTELPPPPNPKPSAPKAATLRRYPPAAPAVTHVALGQPAVADTRTIQVPMHARAGMLQSLINLARRLRLPRTTVGYSAFVLFGLSQRCRPFIWEGEERIDLILVYAPWAESYCHRECAVDGVACAMVARSGGHAEMHPISEAHPLSETHHWIAGHNIGGDMGQGVGPMQTFYNPLGMVLLGTVVDNDCGLDTMCMMLQMPQTAEHRDLLRIGVSDYLLRHLDTPWMHELMVALCELSGEDLNKARSCGLLPPAHTPLMTPHEVIEVIEVEAEVSPAEAAPVPAPSGLDEGRHRACVGDEGIEVKVGASLAEAAPVTAPSRLEAMRQALFGDEEESTDDADDACADGPPAAVEPVVTDNGIGGQCAPAGPASTVAGPASAVADSQLAVAGAATSSDAALQALAWATGSKDKRILLSLQRNLPEWSLQEQQRGHAALLQVVRTAPESRVAIQPHVLASRNQVCAAFRDLLAQLQLPAPASAVADSQRPQSRTIFKLHRGNWRVNSSLWDSFLCKFAWPRTIARRSAQHKLVLRWYADFLAAGDGLNPKQVGVRGARLAIPTAMRKRRAGDCGAHLVKAPIVRRKMYEWWLSVRWSVDWQKQQSELNGRLKSRGLRKAMGRFPRSMLQQKCLQLQTEYAEESLKRGLTVKLFAPTTKWFKGWEQEYGLSMRAPNRKYKCSKELLGQRLEACWITVFRIRALCIACHGYDPEMENFDQTPYHANESGSLNVKTLAVAGSTVPLIEGHGDTRMRWTANLTTFSDVERIKRGELPYCEFMFKHDIKGEESKLELRLREHIRARGYGPWVSVATSSSGSYAQDDILTFLDTHLPRPQSRAKCWRIMFADDFAAHKVNSVRRLCWQRGYILIVLGGGTTPFVQTCDTDLNQHVRREYVALETGEFIHHFQRGESVPKLAPETMIDLMVEVLQNPALHVQAAAGYKKTALAVDLDGREDLEIVREAAAFWRDLKMRPKIDAEVAMVRAEVAARRLAWTYEAVVNLIVPYRLSKKQDAALERCHDAGHCDMAAERWTAAGGVEPDGSESDGSESDIDGEPSGGVGAGQDAGADAWAEGGSAVAGWVGEGGGPAVAGGVSDGGGPAVAGGVSGGGGPAVQAEANLSPEVSIQFHALHDNIACLQRAKQELISNGLLKAAHLMQVEVAKETRRLRTLAREDTHVLQALDEITQVAAQREHALVRRAEEAHQQVLTVNRIKSAVADADRELRKKRQAIQDLENATEVKHAMKTFTPELLGQGQKKAGGPRGQRARFDLLDRLANLGAGLSPDQKNDWAWFKSAWDTKMVAEHDGEWASKFAGIVQQVLDDMAQETGSNEFSCFVHRETLRCLSDQVAVRVPAAQR
jgi:hypothetical protein